jgi:hypothetical protein
VILMVTATQVAPLVMMDTKLEFFYAVRNRIEEPRGGWFVERSPHFSVYLGPDTEGYLGAFRSNDPRFEEF